MFRIKKNSRWSSDDDALCCQVDSPIQYIPFPTAWQQCTVITSHFFKKFKVIRKL